MCLWSKNLLFFIHTKFPLDKVLFTVTINLISDFVDNTIYWNSYMPNTQIHSSLLNGFNIMELGVGVDFAFGLDVSRTHIYYSDWAHGIFRSEKSNPTSDILIYSNYPVMNVKIFKPQGMLMYNVNTICLIYSSLNHQSIIKT